MVEAEHFPYQEYVERVWNQHDADLMDEYFAQDVILHSVSPGLEPGVGIVGLKELTKGFFDSFPDLHFVVEDVLCDRNKLAARILIEGTHKGEYMGVAPTDKRVAFRDFVIYYIKNGKITDAWGLIDQYGLMQQIGAIKS